MALPRDRRGMIVPPSTYEQTAARRTESAASDEKRAIAALRAHHTRFANRHGIEALIAFLKTDLAARGEDRQRLDRLAPKFERSGQASILDAGR